MRAKTKKLGLAVAKPPSLWRKYCSPIIRPQVAISTLLDDHPEATSLPVNPLTRQSSEPSIAKMADSDAPVTLRTRKFIRNPLLGRKQMVV